MPLSLGALQQVVEQNDDKNEEAHKRLRNDLRESEERLHTMDIRMRELESKVSLLIAAPPPDVMTLRFPLPIVIGIAAGFLTIGGGILKSQADLSSLRTEMINRLDSTANASANSIQNLKETIIRLDQQQRLQYAEFQTFRQEMARGNHR
jgi:gas vesicle protein